MDPDQPARMRSLIKIHAVRLPTLLQVDKLIADTQADLDPCWSQTHYVGFVVTRLICFTNGVAIPNITVSNNYPLFNP
jgi:hypothetical protein